jgi:hypothetical protein
MAKATKETKKKERVIEPAVREFNNEKNIIYTVSDPRDKSGHGYEVVWPIPETDEECRERYDCELKDLIMQGVRNLATRPMYVEQGFIKEEDGSFTEKPDCHQQMQDLADNYQVGRKSQGVSVKAKAKEYDKAAAKAAEVGFDLSNIDKLLAKAKALGIDPSDLA